MSQNILNLNELVPSRFDRVVAAEPGRNGTGTLYIRTAENSLKTSKTEFMPWLLVAGGALAASIPEYLEIRSLKGSGVYNSRVIFSDQSSYYDAIQYLKKETGFNPSSPLAPYRLFTDMTQQLLSVLPCRLFRGMTFEQLHRLQLDIETLTTGGYDFPNAERPGDEIIIISMRDSSGWECCLAGPELSEKEILQKTMETIRRRDPDVIEGHNIFSFDLPYIEARCKHYDIRLKLGRDGSAVRSRPSRFSAGERVTSYRRYDISGRHIIDTMHLVQLYDVVYRDLDSYSLKAVARHFDVAATARTYVRGEDISELYANDPATLCAYAMDDVRETEAISRILSPSYFYQAQLLPLSYQNCVTRGNATRIDALLSAAYILEDHGLPTPEAPRNFRGGLTESLRTGVFKNVWHVDVRSLYPSIIISRNLRPRHDYLNLFNKFLRELRQFRYLAKDAARTADAAEKEHFQALQSSFKILLNSFYGYTGFSQGTFNDYEVAETVTAAGREILQSMIDFLENANATVIEMDTDGIYFVPPPDTAAPGTIQQRMQQILPAGIEVELDATYAAMFGYKSKNYALLGHDGKIAVTGAALKSRGLEPFQRRYMHQLITLLLTNQPEKCNELMHQYRQDIVEHRLPIADFAKKEILSTPPKRYKEKLAAGKTRRSAAYELALKAEREYRQGDQVAFYVTGTKKSIAVTDAAKLLTDAAPGVRDENVPYYIDKLAKLQHKFAAFL